jgi:hypothetical protein
LEAFYQYKNTFFQYNSEFFSPLFGMLRKTAFLAEILEKKKKGAW